MGKFKRFEVLFDSPVSAFYSGCVITGRVLLELSESHKIQAVKLKTCGLAAVLVSKDEKASKKPTAEEIYMNDCQTLFGDGDASFVSGGLMLQKGVHEYRFTYRLPDKLPSSFESTYGYVRFWFQASVHRPWKPQQSVKRPFSVVGTANLNTMPEAFTPGRRSVQRSFSLLERFICCVAGGITMTLSIERCAYVPGEIIYINGEVSNYSDKLVTSVQAFLQQNLTFKSNVIVKQCKGISKIGCIEKGPIPLGDSQIWHMEPLQVPPLPPTDLAECKLISVTYLLKFIATVANGGPNVYVHIPVTIGTVPLEPSIMSMSETSMINASAPLEPVEPMAATLEHFIGPPPSYAECTDMASGDFMNAEDENEEISEGGRHFRPLYPTYATLMTTQPSAPMLGHK